jgi:hypothetical protein
MTSRFFLLAFLVAGACAGCALPGERASLNNNGTGKGAGCPTGEVCSPATPQGLYFTGGTTFDTLFANGPAAVAVGGTETITVLRSSNTSDTFDAPFHAEGTSVITIEGVSPPEVTVHATAAGSGYLRILDPGSSQLYDRVLLASDKVATTGFLPAAKALVDSDVPADKWALYHDASVLVGAQLRSAGGVRLVDESIKLTVSGAAMQGTSTQWDTAAVQTAASGEAIVTAKLGDGTTFSHTYPIAEKIDQIAQVGGLPGDKVDTAPVPPDSQAILCFRATTGDLAIAGVPWKISADPDVEVVDNGSFLDSCFVVSSKVIGKHTITISAEDKQIAVVLEVAKSAPKRVKPQRWERAPEIAAGERAADEE